MPAREATALTETHNEPTEIVTLGETMVLLYPEEGHSIEDSSYLRRSIGGAESNFAIALARLGHSVRWISRLGDDPFGRYMRATLEREKVVVDAPTDSAAPTALYLKEPTAGSGRRVYYYRRGSAASLLAAEHLGPEQFGGARVFHFTGITPALSASCAASVQRAVALARAAGATVTFDPNVRPALWPSGEGCRQTLVALIEQVDVVLLGDEDAAVLFPATPEEDILDAVLALGPRTAVLKLGSRGAVAKEDGHVVRVPAIPVEVVDTVGAGDGFDAGFVAGLVRGVGLLDCLRFGAQVGAAAVTTRGDWEGYPGPHIFEA